jgi:hypothetical protein
VERISPHLLIVGSNLTLLLLSELIEVALAAWKDRELAERRTMAFLSFVPLPMWWLPSGSMTPGTSTSWARRASSGLSFLAMFPVPPRPVVYTLDFKVGVV